MKRLILFAAALLAGCSNDLTVPKEPTQVLSELRCTATRASVSCVPVSGLRGNLYGGLAINYWKSNVTYNASTWRYEFDMAVGNRLSIRMGTTDGCTPDGHGVTVFFGGSPPVAVSGGSGYADIYNPDGYDTFTQTNQPYFVYPGSLLGSNQILDGGETSGARHWVFLVEPTVTEFQYTLYVSANAHSPVC